MSWGNKVLYQASTMWVNKTIRKGDFKITNDIKCETVKNIILLIIS